MCKYIIIIERTENCYSAYCPDLPGCIATGSTMEGTVRNMKEAVEFHVEGMKQENVPIPEPSTEVASIELKV